MLNIIFTNKDFELDFVLDKPEDITFDNLRKYQSVGVSCDDEKVLDYLFQLDLEAYFFDKKNYALESIFIKTKNCNEMANKYKSFLSISNAVRFARDLYHNSSDLSAEINRLQYLGIYLKDGMIYYGKDGYLPLPSDDLVDFCASIGFIKAVATLKLNLAYKMSFNENLSKNADDVLIQKKIVKYFKDLENEKR